MTYLTPVSLIIYSCQRAIMSRPRSICVQTIIVDLSHKRIPAGRKPISVLTAWLEWRDWQGLRTLLLSTITSSKRSSWLIHSWRHYSNHQNGLEWVSRLRELAFSRGSKAMDHTPSGRHLWVPVKKKENDPHTRILINLLQSILTFEYPKPAHSVTLAFNCRRQSRTVME